MKKHTCKTYTCAVCTPRRDQEPLSLAKTEMSKLFSDPKLLQDAAEFSSFCQRFKMKWWKSEETAVGEIRYIPEKILDELAQIAWQEMKKNALQSQLSLIQELRKAVEESPKLMNTFETGTAINIIDLDEEILTTRASELEEELNKLTE